MDLILNVAWDFDRESISIAVLPAQVAILAPAVSAPVEESKHKTIRNAIDVANSIVGTLMLCGHDWADPVLARRSMQLMAEQVMPRVNAALGES